MALNATQPYKFVPKDKISLAVNGHFKYKLKSLKIKY